MISLSYESFPAVTLAYGLPSALTQFIWNVSIYSNIMTESDLLYTQTLETPRDFKQVCCTIHHKSKTAHFNVIGFQLSELIESVFRSLPPEWVNWVNITQFTPEWVNWVNISQFTPEWVNWVNISQFTPEWVNWVNILQFAPHILSIQSLRVDLVFVAELRM